MKQIRPKLPVLILSMHLEEQYARRAFRAGAAGYITKDRSRAELVKAINKAITGGRYASPTVAEKLVFDMERGTDRPLHEALSHGEFEVMRFIALGKTVSEIAEGGDVVAAAGLPLSPRAQPTAATAPADERDGARKAHGFP